MNTYNSPSRHISEDAFYEYLDQALIKEQLDEIEAHLEICQTCSEYLEQHRNLFSAIEGLPEESLKHDLTPEVLSSLINGTALSPIWWWLLILQGSLALGMIALSVPSIVNIPNPISLLDTLKNGLTSIAATLNFWLLGWNSLFGKASQLLSFHTSLSLRIPWQSILWVVSLTTVTWIVGNSILLRPQLTSSQR
ncbi:MAG: hypothetical protein ISR58_01190 [Anaerolineales bacterium]|nr:hypothetical protein [Chloroflexota bacterium]MBL6979779.1 hypothetical protein [Anaerolineales bacterium]